MAVAVEPAQQILPAEEPAPQSAVKADVAASAAEDGLPPTASTAVAQGPSADLAPFDYVPRKLLSVAPRAKGAVLLKYPDGPEEVDDVSFVVALYIDETGQVRRARVDGGNPPERFASAAIASFSAAWFEPGQVDGQAVRSLIRVEVRFSTGK